VISLFGSLCSRNRESHTTKIAVKTLPYFVYANDGSTVVGKNHATKRRWGKASELHDFHSSQSHHTTLPDTATDSQDQLAALSTRNKQNSEKPSKKIDSEEQTKSSSVLQVESSHIRDDNYYRLSQ
jgi:hypothetical protein